VGGAAGGGATCAPGIAGLLYVIALPILTRVSRRLHAPAGAH